MLIKNARKLSSASNILPLYIRLLAVLHFILTDKTLGFLVKRKNGTRRLLNVDALNNEKETPLFRALHNGNKDLVDTLTQGTIKNGFADVNKSCRGGTTPLLKALSLSSPGSKDRRDIVNRLLQKGADVNAKDVPSTVNAAEFSGGFAPRRALQVRLIRLLSCLFLVFTTRVFFSWNFRSVLRSSPRRFVDSLSQREIDGDACTTLTRVFFTSF